ncbi:cytosol aminopeptidase-like [Bombyx mandarina]|uniref:Cytosol aminopeptidase n=1 Tax=Bombyx mandarina TaxID=7092 RepID=A0A6J2KDI2_BOMMA|nr:cytosol aminopeptidase-like [Bombyx mandarina]
MNKLNIKLIRKFSDSCQEASGEINQKLDSSKKGLVLGVYQCGKKLELTSAGQELDQKSGGKILQHLNELSERMKLGQAFVLTDVVPEYSAVALASLGPKDPGYNQLEALDETRENLRWAVGAGVRVLQNRGCGDISVQADAEHDAAAEAAELAAWRFEEFRSVEERQPACRLSLHGQAGGEGPGGAWHAGSVLGRAQNWARFLSDMPANKMTPIDLGQAALDTLCPLGVTVEAREREWIEAQNMQAFLTVARGSCEEPIFLECNYRGDKESRPPVVIAAKGVTFDSGGLCLKKRESMVENRGSMAGAAAVLGALRALAELQVPINVCAVIPICENMVSGQCMKVGDVVRALNGLSIQIEDTDMEGRLMLADALVYGQAVHKPELVIDVATFTKGVLQALGGAACGCYTESEALWRDVTAAGARSGDRAWRLPLWDYYRRQITDDPSVDLRNKGSGKATSCLGAAFLKSFVCCSWLHVDTTGVGKLAHGSAPPYLSARRMTGRPARTLVALLQRLAAAP